MTIINSITSYRNEVISQESDSQQNNSTFNTSAESPAYTSFLDRFDSSEEVINYSSSILSVYDRKNEIIQGEFVDLLENKDFLRVISYNQRFIDGNLSSFLVSDNNNNFLSLFNNFFKDLETLKSKFYSFESIEEFLIDSKVSIENYFKFIREIDYIFAYDKVKDKDLNYANKLVSFLKEKQSKDFGKIFNMGFIRNSLERINNSENFRLLSNQSYEETFSFNFINEAYIKKFLRIENIDIELTDVNNNFIYNSDKMFTQIVLDTFNSYYGINSDLILIDIESISSNSLVFKNEDYPVIQIGNRIFKHNILNYLEGLSFSKEKFIKENKELISLDYNKKSSHRYNKNKFSVYNYEKLEDNYISSAALLDIRFDDSKSLPEGRSPELINETKNDCVFIDECSIYHGNILDALAERDYISILDMQDFADEISGTPNSVLPLSFFKELESSNGGKVSFLNFDVSNNSSSKRGSLKARLSNTDSILGNTITTDDFTNNLNLIDHKVFINQSGFYDLNNLIASFNSNEDVLDIESFQNWDQNKLNYYINYEPARRWASQSITESSNFESTDYGVIDEIISVILITNDKLNYFKDNYDSIYNYNTAYSNSSIGYNEKIKSILQVVKKIITELLKLYSIQQDFTNILSSLSGDESETSATIIAYLNSIHRNRIANIFNKSKSLLENLLRDFKLIFLVENNNSEVIKYIDPTRGIHPNDVSNNYLKFVSENQVSDSAITTTTYYTYEEKIYITTTGNHNFYEEGKTSNQVSWPIFNNERGENINQAYEAKFDNTNRAFDQFFWFYNHNKNNKTYPRLYDFIFNAISDFIRIPRYRLLSSTIRNLELSQDFNIAGIFKDFNNTLAIDEIVELSNSFSNSFTRGETIDYYEVRSLFDFHTYKLDGSLNKKTNNIRSNYIEPAGNYLNFLDLKVNFLNNINETRRYKLSQENLDLKDTLDFGSKVYKRSNLLSKEGKDISFSYGNENNENVLLLDRDEELSHLIEDNIMNNNFKKDLYFNAKQIKTTRERTNKSITSSFDYKSYSENIKKMTSLIYCDSIFKDSRSLIKKVLSDIVDYSNELSSEVSEPFLLNATNSTIVNVSLLDKLIKDSVLKKRSVYSNYDNFMSEIFSNDCSYDDSSSYLKRLLSYVITKNTNFSSVVEDITEVNYKEENKVFEENIEDIIKINKINDNSKDIFNFIYSKNNIKKLTNYTLVQYSNSDTFSQDIQYNVPVNIWTCNRNSESGLSSFNSIYNHSNLLDYNYDLFLEKLNESNNYKNFYVKINDRQPLGGENYKLNVPDDFNIVKKINVKDYEKININLDEEDKLIDLTYKFYCNFEEKLWLVKSRIKGTGLVGAYESITNPFEKDEQDNLKHPDFPFDKITTMFPSFDMFYHNANNENSMINKFCDLVYSLLKYNDLDFTQFKKYDDVLEYVDANSDLVRVVYENFKVYCKIFNVLFKRLENFKIYSLIEILSSKLYMSTNTDNSNKNKRSYAGFHSTCKSFLESKMLTKDIEELLKIINENSENQDDLLNITQLYNQAKEEQDIFNSNDTEILIDLIKTCIHNDAINALRFDSILGFYNNFEKINDKIQSRKEDSIESVNYIESYNTNDYDLKDKVDNEFIKNIISKKIQNSYYLKFNTYNDLINMKINSRDKKNIEHFKYNKKLHLNKIKLLDRFYNKINTSAITGEDEGDKYLDDNYFDFIKIGIDSKQIYNLQPNSVLKFSVFTIEHEKIGNTYLSDGSVGTNNVKCFLYAPFLTSMPESYYDIIEDKTEKYVGFYNVNNKISKRFNLATMDEVSRYVNLYLKTSYDDVVSEYPSLDEFISENNFGRKIFTDMYFSQFAEYYESLSNKINNLEISVDNNDISKFILNETFNKFNSISDNNFKNIFNKNKSQVINLSQINENFTILKSRKEEIDMNNKANSFIDNYSKISSDIDIYKNLIESKYYDFFNIMIKSPENTNYSYAIKVELL
jgi:hypothetical protein